MPRAGRRGAGLWAPGTEPRPDGLCCPLAFGGLGSGGRHPAPRPPGSPARASSSPPPPLAFLVRDGQEVPPAVQIHQGPGRVGDTVSAPGLASVGSRDLSGWRGLGASGPVSLGIREGTSIGARNVPTAAPKDGRPDLPALRWAQRGAMACPGSHSEAGGPAQPPALLEEAEILE